MNRTYNVDAYDKDGCFIEGADFCFNSQREALKNAISTAKRLSKRNFYVEITNGLKIVRDFGKIPKGACFDRNRVSRTRKFL